MLILAFDTATDRATSALVGDGEVLGERVSRASTLLEDVDALLRQAGAHAGAWLPPLRAAVSMEHVDEQHRRVRIESENDLRL